jgi:mono/diheme cytochrome c family protein
VEAELATLEEREAAATLGDGVFTDAQADRGETVYASACGLCHGRRLDGAAADPNMRASPPLARAPFLREWEGRSVAALFGYTRTTMPQHNPGSLSDQEYVDVVAYILAYNEMPPGESDLEADLDALADIMIEAAPD